MSLFSKSCFKFSLKTSMVGNMVGQLPPVFPWGARLLKLKVVNQL